MSGQFDRRDFEQNPANLKKKRSRKDWDTNNASDLCSEGVLTESEIKQIKEENWLEKHVPKPSKREIKYSERINELENASIQAPLSKKESKELKKLNKKYKKAYKYRHRDLSSSHCCLKSCLVALTLCIVFSCVAFFGGYHFFVQPYTGITLFEAYDLVKGVYNVDEKDIVHQTFDAEEEGNAFFAGLQKALYLDTSFTIKDLLALIPQSNGGAGDDTATIADLIDMAGEPDDSNSSGSLTGNPEFDKLLQDAKFDFSSLKDYNGGAPVWEITDKSVAGVLQQAINELSTLPQFQEIMQDMKINITNMLAVRQCLITQDANEVNTIEVVIQVKIHNLINEIIAGQDLGKFDGLVKAGLPLILKSLPNNIYLIARTTPELDKAPTLGINSINSEVLQRLITTLDSKVLNGQIESIFNSAGNTIFSTIKKINELATEGSSAGIKITPSSENSDGKVEINILQALMKKMNVENVTSSDFLLMVKHLHLVNLEHNGDTTKYIDANYSDIKDKTTSPEQFEKSKNELFSAYGIDTSDLDIVNITAENFIESFSSETIQNKIQLKNDRLYDSDYDTIKADSKLSDAALGQVMNSLIKKQVGDQIDMEIVLLDMQENLMNIVAKIDIEKTIKSMVGGQFGAFESLLMSMFPTTMYVEITVPYDKEAEGFKVIFNYKTYYDDQVKDDAENQAQSEKMFDTISKLLSSFVSEDNSLHNLTMERVENKLKNAIYPALDNLNIENAGIKVEPTADGLQFPTVFDIIAVTVNTDGEPRIEAYEIQDALRGYYKYNGENIGDSIANALSDIELTGNGNFVSRELTNKFFMKAYIDSNGSPKLLNSINEEDVFSAIKSIATSISADNIAKIIDIEKMSKNNDKHASDGDLNITALELAKLISLSGELNQDIDIGVYQDFKFTDMSLDVNDNNTLLSLVISAKLNDSANSVGGFDINNFATSYLIINATVDLKTVVGEGENAAYKTTIAINDAKDDNIDKLLKIITKMTGSNPADFNQTTVANNIGKAIYSAFKNFADQGIELVPTRKVLTSRPDGGVPGFKSSNIYELVGKKTMLDKYEEGDDDRLRSVICKLNNPTEYMSTFNDVIQGEGDSYETPTDDKHPTSQTLKLVKKVNKDGVDVLNIHDAYIGRQLRELVLQGYTQGFELTRFAILNDPAKRAKDPIKPGEPGYNIDPDRSNFDRIINGLNIRDLVAMDSTGKDYNADIFTEFGKGYEYDKGLMYFNFRVGKNQLIQEDSPMRALLPENVYSGAFLNLNAMVDGGVNIMCTYLNDLTKDELDMLTKMSTESITAPVVNAINKVLQEKMTFEIEGSGQIQVGIGQLLNLSLSSLANDTEYIGYTYSYFEGTLAELMA